MKGLMRTCGVAVVVGLLTVASAHAIGLKITPTSQTVGLGDSASVDIEVYDLGAEIVAAFDLDLLYDPAILDATDVEFGSELSLGMPFIFSLPSEDLSIPGVVDFAEVSLLPDAFLSAIQPDSFTLATISFDAIGLGTSALTLVVNDDPLFNDVKGLENGVLDFDLVADGSITVVEELTPTPEPGTISLLGVGLIGMLGYGWYRRREEV